MEDSASGTISTKSERKRVTRCSVPGCSNSSRGPREGIFFFNFPKNKDRELQWAKAVRLPQEKITKSSRVCQDHFGPEDFLPDFSELQEEYNICRSMKKLHRMAVPSAALDLLADDESNCANAENQNNGDPDHLEDPIRDSVEEVDGYGCEEITNDDIISAGAGDGAVTKNADDPSTDFEIFDGIKQFIVIKVIF